MPRAIRNLSLSAQGSIGPGGALGGSANPSGDTSACVFQYWKVTTHFLMGAWKRYWQYGSEPTPVGGLEGNPVSACPYLDGNYVTLQGQVTTNISKVHASYCSGAWNPLGIQLFLDDYYNLSGSYSTSGSFTTAQVGETRVTWDDNTDVESYCNEPFTTTLSIQDGDYNPSFDTSANFTSEFVKALYDAKDVCPTFDPNIVAG